MKRGIRYVLISLLSVFLMSHNVFAIELTSDVTIKQGNYRSTIAISGNCTRYNQFFVLNQNADVVCGIGALSLSTPDRNDYAIGDFITQTIYLNNSARNDSGDFWGRFNEYSVSTSGTANADLVDIKYEQLSGSSSKITFISRVWSAGNIYQLSYGFPNAAMNLWQNEELTTGMTTVWSEKNTNIDYSVTLGNINSFLSSINSHISSIDDHVLWNNQELLQIKLNSGTISGNVADIEALINTMGQKLDNLPQDTADAVTETEEEKVKESADEAEAGANDAQADSEAATSSLLDTVTGVFNAIINANATNCTFDSHLPFMSGNGTIDLCEMPAPPIVQGIGSLIALGLFAPFALHMFRRFVSITESFQR